MISCRFKTFSPLDDNYTQAFFFLSNEATRSLIELSSRAARFGPGIYDETRAIPITQLVNRLMPFVRLTDRSANLMTCLRV